MRASRRTRAGFTLVEVMVSLTVFALLAAASLALLNFSITNRAAVKDASEAGERLQRARQLLRADLSQATERGVRGPGGGGEPAMFGGEGERMLVLTRAGWSNAEAAPRASLQRVEYAVTQGRLERRVHAALDGGGEPLVQVLMEDVDQARIGFVASGVTYPSWPAPGRATLPDAVTLEMTVPRFGPVTQWFLIGGGPG